MKSGSHVEEGRRVLYVTTDFEENFKATGATPKDANANKEGQGPKDVLEIQDLDLVWKDG